MDQKIVRGAKPKVWWIWRVLLWIDQGANVLFSPLLNWILHHQTAGNPPAWFGYEDETLSSVFGKNREVCKACYVVCRLLHWVDKDHCKKSIEADEGCDRNH